MADVGENEIENETEHCRQFVAQNRIIHRKIVKVNLPNREPRFGIVSFTGSLHVEESQLLFEKMSGVRKTITSGVLKTIIDGSIFSLKKRSAPP